MPGDPQSCLLSPLGFPLHDLAESFYCIFHSTLPRLTLPGLGNVVLSVFTALPLTTWQPTIILGDPVHAKSSL
jgi:hypothetical protein